MQQGTTLEVVAGLVSGVGSNVVTHPLGRASYLSVVNKAPFFSSQNFVNPLEGIMAKMFIGTALSTEYFMAQDFARTSLNPYLQAQLNVPAHVAQFVSGGLAGSVHGQLANSSMAVQNFSHKTGYSVFGSVRHMYSQGGMKPFIKGAGVSMFSGAAFSALYQPIRTMMTEVLEKNNEQHDHKLDNSTISMLSNLTGATVAGSAIAPLSYARQVQQASCATQNAPSVATVFKVLAKEIGAEKSLVGKFGLFNARVHPGPRVMLIAGGLAVGQTLFDCVVENLPNAKLPDVESVVSKNIPNDDHSGVAVGLGFRQ
jgi:hypothetical protein